jgi:hypothetical protein
MTFIYVLGLNIRKNIFNLVELLKLKKYTYIYI